MATTHGYLLVPSYNLVGGRFYFSAANEEQVTLPAWTLDKMPLLTSSPPALGPSMMTVFKEARKRFNVNGTEINGQKINPYSKSKPLGTASTARSATRKERPTF